MLKKAGLFLLILLIALPLFSADKEKEVSLFVGLNHMDVLGSDLAIGGGVFIPYSEMFGGEFEFTYVPGSVFGVIDTSLVFVNGNFVGTIKTEDESFVPYFTAGGGLCRASASFLGVGDSATHFAINFGGGIKIPVMEKLFVRGDFRLFYIFFEGEGSHLTERFVGGISYCF
ncbi:MAG: outer membrane beta-barrel protein [Acidobacteria bacterium]|nr:outer membrane beta-barrel protein [Acidobacteriota bacterium]